MRHVFKFLGVLLSTAAVLWAVHTFAFTVYKVPAAGLVDGLTVGDRVVVNRLGPTHFRRGDLVVFTDSVSHFIGQVVALPGDTVPVGTQHYLLPTVCCSRCGCPDCKFYLLRAGRQQLVVHRHLILGKCYKLYHLNF